MSGEKRNKTNEQTYSKNWDGFTLLSTIKLVKNNIFHRNLDTFKLLISFDKFQETIMQARERLNKATPSNRLNLLNELDTMILQKFNLPENFRSALAVYLQTNKIKEKEIPNRNYGFNFIPRPKFTEGIIEKPVQVVSLMTYTKLTNQELDEAIMALKKIQKIAFPNTKLFSKTKFHKNIDREIEIEKRSQKRTLPKIKEEFYDVYLDVQKKRFEGGQISKKEWNKIRRVNKINIKRGRKSGYTSKNIVKELDVNIKPNTLGHIIKRLKKERKDRFEPKDKN